MVVVSPVKIVFRFTVQINTRIPQKYHLRCYTNRQSPRTHILECYNPSEVIWVLRLMVSTQVVWGDFRTLRPWLGGVGCSWHLPPFCQEEDDVDISSSSLIGIHLVHLYTLSYHMLLLLICSLLLSLKLFLPECYELLSL